MIQLKIEGMTCGHCVMSVKEALASVQGVEGPVEVDLKAGAAWVNGAPDPQDLILVVEDEGFSAVLAR